MKLNIHKDKMVWYNRKYCIMAFLREEIQIKSDKKINYHIIGILGGNRENETWYRYYEADFINVHISC